MFGNIYGLDLGTYEIKVFDKKGSLEDGKDADIVLLDEENNIADVFVGGKYIER